MYARTRYRREHGAGRKRGDGLRRGRGRERKRERECVRERRDSATRAPRGSGGARGAVLLSGGTAHAACAPRVHLRVRTCVRALHAHTRAHRAYGARPHRGHSVMFGFRGWWWGAAREGGAPSASRYVYCAPRRVRYARTRREMSDELLVRNEGCVGALGVSARLVARKYGWFVAMNHEKKTHDRCGIFQGIIARTARRCNVRLARCAPSLSLSLAVSRDQVPEYFSVIAME